MNDSDSITKQQEPGSLFAPILDLLSLPKWVEWNLHLFVEGMLVTLVSVYVVRGVGIPESGMIAVALSAAAMVQRFNAILITNRTRIWQSQGSGRQVNTQSALSVISIFFGLFAGFLIVALITDPQTLYEHFRFILKEVQFRPGETLSPERFSSGSSVFIHNATVLLAFALLAFLYRSLGAMIALGWNASVWATTLVLYVKGGSGLEGNDALYGLLVVVAILPHLIIEAVAYIVGSLSAIFLSRGITVYEATDPLLRRVLVAVLVLAVTSVVLLLIGALVESTFAPNVLKLL